MFKEIKTDKIQLSETWLVVVDEWTDVWIDGRKDTWTDKYLCYFGTGECISSTLRQKTIAVRR